MDFFNTIYMVLFLGCAGLLFGSIILWIATVITDRENEEKRKKYAKIVLIIMILAVLMGVAIFIINFKRNMK